MNVAILVLLGVIGCILAAELLGMSKRLSYRLVERAAAKIDDPHHAERYRA